jgi:hypothetical protein
MEYNTQREHLVISEYGRNVQAMVRQLLTMKDKEQRQKNAEALVEIMAILNNQMKGVEDYKQKFWDHLFVITNYELDVDSPYGVPERAVKEAKPDPLAYPTRKIRWNHLGKNIEKLYINAMEETDADKKRGYAQALGNYMKVAYKNYHEENATDEQIKEEINQMSKGELVYDANEFRKWVDGSLNESAIITNIRNHTQNKNYIEGKRENNRMGNNRNQQSSFRGNNKFGNKNFKNKR